MLLAKVNALLRRTSARELEAEALSAGKITLMPSARKVYVDGQEAALTHMEYELLFFFFKPSRNGLYQGTAPGSDMGI